MFFSERRIPIDTNETQLAKAERAYAEFTQECDELITQIENLIQAYISLAQKQYPSYSFLFDEELSTILFLDIVRNNTPIETTTLPVVLATEIKSIKQVQTLITAYRESIHNKNKDQLLKHFTNKLIGYLFAITPEGLLFNAILSQIERTIHPGLLKPDSIHMVSAPNKDNQQYELIPGITKLPSSVETKGIIENECNLPKNQTLKLWGFVYHKMPTFMYAIDTETLDKTTIASYFLESLHRAVAELKKTV